MLSFANLMAAIQPGDSGGRIWRWIDHFGQQCSVVRTHRAIRKKMLTDPLTRKHSACRSDTTHPPLFSIPTATCEVSLAVKSAQVWRESM
jgi:hypothetical protein